MPTTIGAGLPPSVLIQAQVQMTGADAMPKQLIQNVQQNIQQAVQGLESMMQSLMGAAGGAQSGGGAASSSPAASPGAFSMPGLDSSGWAAKFSEMAQVGSALDSMEKQAMQDMQSPDKSKQIKGQQEMQAMQQIMSAIMKAISTTGELAKQAIQGSQAQ